LFDNRQTHITKTSSALSGSPAIMGHEPVRSVTLRPPLSQSLPFSYCIIYYAQIMPLPSWCG